MLTTLDQALSAALARDDRANARQVIAARVATWYALADLASEVHPAYALACEAAARWEHHTGARLPRCRASGPATVPSTAGTSGAPHDGPGPITAGARPTASETAARAAGQPFAQALITAMKRVEAC